MGLGTYASARGRSVLRLSFESDELKWYTNIAPVSWLVDTDVKGGREHLDFSEWDKPQGEVGDIVEAVRNGSMPPCSTRRSTPPRASRAPSARRSPAGSRRPSQPIRPFRAAAADDRTPALPAGR